jgi:hypothetical protein
MNVTAIEKCNINIKGFPVPRPVTSAAQNEHLIEVLYNLERRGRLWSAEEVYASSGQKQRGETGR